MDLDRIAVALALTRFMLNLPYSSWMTTDFDFPNDNNNDFVYMYTRQVMAINALIYFIIES